MTGNTKKKNNTSNYYTWIERNRKSDILAQEQKRKFMDDLKGISSM